MDPSYIMGVDSQHERLARVLAQRNVVDLPTLQATLGGASPMTVFRHLKQLPYRSSYNHRGRYYTLHEPGRYDRFGLWSADGVHFSIDGSLRNTVRRLVEESDAGATQQELRDRLQVRVHNTLLDLLRSDEIAREKLLEVYVYLHRDPKVQATQRERRRQRIDVVSTERAESVDDDVVIAVLLTLLRHRAADAEEVARHLRGRSPPIRVTQVREVFARFDLDALGEKGGTSRS